MRSVLAAVVLGLIVVLSASLHAAEAAPKWIWASSNPSKADAKVAFRKTLDLPLPEGTTRPAYGEIIITCDDSYVLFVNGKKAGEGTNWAEPQTLDITRFLQPGKNVLAVECKNDGETPAGLIAKVLIRLEGNNTLKLTTDASWKQSVTAGKGWQSATFKDDDWKPVAVLGSLGVQPWGNKVKLEAEVAQSTPADAIQTLPGFKIELLHSVRKSSQGSWVNLCLDGKGRIIASDQRGLLYRITPDKPAKGEAQVEPIELYTTTAGPDGKPVKQGKAIGAAHGLCWAYDSLYVVIADGGGMGNGLYRVRDTNNDDQFDTVDFLKALKGSGEHGPHAVRLGPDGMLWVMAGNHTDVPADILPQSPLKNYKEDQLLPRNPDGNGHATGRMAPGGWICRVDKDGKTWNLWCGGFRNSFDYDWNQDGEVFTYDSDMEWDTGSPWYRPTRVNHAVSAADFGWRFGTGKWPEYYPDSLGAVINIGRGSPTGVVSGAGAKFPAKYQRAMFVLDWTYGKLYAIHLQPQGASYTATAEVFVEGKPLPLTDAVIGKDGALYFTIGGRNTQSGLYRVTYTGKESTAAIPQGENPVGKADRELRRKLEAFHGKVDPAAVDFAWNHLNSADRSIRYAARVAIEWQPASQWLSRALAETRPTALIQAMLAVARTNDASQLATAIEALHRLNIARLSEEQQLEALRAYGLLFSRLGRPSTDLAQATIAKINGLFPGSSERVNREVAAVLVYLQEPTIVARALKHMSSQQTQENQFYYVFILRHAEAGWTPELRTQQFAWLNLAREKYTGGNSFKKFLEQVRNDTLSHMGEQEKTALASVIKGEQKVVALANTTPRQYVHNWQMTDLTPVLDQANKGRDFARGRSAFEATGCLQCHRFNDEGGGVGPDLSSLGSRFSPADVLESIIDPNKVVSDQYAATEFVLGDGEVVSGYLVNETEQMLTIRSHPLASESVEVKKSDVKDRRISKTSFMPAGLLSILQKDEVLDLIAYLRSAGNPKDPAFAK